MRYFKSANRNSFIAIDKETHLVIQTELHKDSVQISIIEDESNYKYFMQNLILDKPKETKISEGHSVTDDNYFIVVDKEIYEDHISYFRNFLLPLV